MGLKGNFEWYNSLRTGGGKTISFTLTCDNLFQSESFDCAIMSSNGAIQPMIWRGQTLKAKQSLRFNFDTVDWQWCNGDAFVILDKNDSIKKKWTLNLQQYAPGECPECHSTLKCRKCSGKGFLYLPNHTMEQCDVCHGTGVCQTCYIPVRNFSHSNFSRQTGPGQQGGTQVMDRQIENLRRQITDLQSKIEKTQWDMRIMQLKDMDRTNSSVYLSYNQLLHRYNIQMVSLQSQLEQLERIRNI